MKLDLSTFNIHPKQMTHFSIGTPKQDLPQIVGLLPTATTRQFSLLCMSVASID